MRIQAPTGKFRVICNSTAFGLKETLLVGDRDTQDEAMELMDEHHNHASCLTMYDDAGTCIAGGFAYFHQPPCPKTHEGDLSVSAIFVNPGGLDD
jgi:hypothetical protein